MTWPGGTATGDRLDVEPAPPPAPPRPSRASVAALVAVFCGLLLGALGTVVHLPYAVMMPGPISNVLGQATHENGQQGDLIVIGGRKTYPTTGSLDFTTVRINGGPGFPVDVWDVVAAWVDPTQEVLPVDEVFPPQQTQQDVEKENQAEMVGSQQEATAVALRKAGFALTERVKVGTVAKDAPSGGALQAGDVLVSIGGAAVTGPTSARAGIQKVTAGSVVDVAVTRKGAPLTVRAKTGKAADGRTVLGIGLAADFVFPFPVTIDAGAVGGPSAGMMFSLGIYDKLTEGPLTGGRNIAGTGTIDSSGAVGPIGGIQQKMAGARRGGATFFLAPARNCDEVRGHVPDGLEAFKVATFEEALNAVTHIASGDTAALPHC